MGKRVLILCTGNSCRSQMAEGYLKSLRCDFEVFSAGTKPSERVNPLAVEVMKEIGIDISDHYPKNVDEFLNQSFDYVITVCDNAKESCPVFNGMVGEVIHRGFEDPSEAVGEKSEVIDIYRGVRDEIIKELKTLFGI